MRWLSVLLMFAAVPASAQVVNQPPNRNQAVISGPAGVSARMRSQGYSGIHDLRQLPGGQWVGKATINGMERDVVVAPDGTTVAR